MLEPLGVRPEDETVYRELLSRPEASQRDLAVALDRDAAEVGSSLSRLEELGLVHRLPGQPARMRAARPDVAVDALVDRRREELARTQLAARNLLAEMPAEERFRPEEIVEVLVGGAAIAARFEHLLSTTRHELMVLDRPPYVADPRRSDNSVRRLLRAKVRVRGIYAPEALELPGALEEVQDAAGAGEQSRVHSDLPMKLAIGDRRLAILPLGAQSADAAVCIRPSTLLDALVQLFELLWAQATPIVAPTQEGNFSDRQLAALLASGAKDDVVARRLGTSTRTLSRRIAELMDHLHVRTRFQAGVQAVRLGWLESSAHDVEGPDDGLVDR
ncbi:helix-turn-helix domain-containing protein [Micromonospora sp. NPDC048930]|uniref:helix-turn-helix domain-containing protein n=1 Tax=Micromonospora sp. NPDC048930 TaxID=3364261 RepID=UPI003710AFF1